jgi:hypothetical protein
MPIAVIPPSAYDWPKLLAAAAELLPLAAAWRANRLRTGDPAGQVGITWAIMVLTYPLSLLGLALGELALVTWTTAFAGIALPLLLVPPLLTWIGPAAKRWQPLVLAAFALLTVGSLVVFGAGREFTLMSRTTAHTGLALLVLLMMAAQFRRAANPQSAAVEPGWAWIAGGHLLYFLATVTGRSLLEALVARNRSAVGVASAALFVAYAIAMVAIAWGIRVGARARAGPGVPDGAHVAGSARDPLPTT